MAKRWLRRRQCARGAQQMRCRYCRENPYRRPHGKRYLNLSWQVTVKESDQCQYLMVGASVVTGLLLAHRMSATISKQNQYW